MGSDPKTSVVNRYGQIWDIPNLFVVGCSTFPSMSGFNPTLTHHPGARVHERRCDHESLQEQARTDRLARSLCSRAATRRAV